MHFIHKYKENITAPTRDGKARRPWRLTINLRMLKTLVMHFLAFKPEFSRRLSRIFFSASSRLSRNFRGRLAGLEKMAAAGRLSRRLRGLLQAPSYTTQRDRLPGRPIDRLPSPSV